MLCVIFDRYTANGINFVRSDLLLDRTVARSPAVSVPYNQHLMPSRVIGRVRDKFISNKSVLLLNFKFRSPFSCVPPPKCPRRGGVLGSSGARSFGCRVLLERIH